MHQYTVRGIPPRLDAALREKARRERKSINRLAVELLSAALGLDGVPAKRRDLSDVAGSWVADPKVDRALRDQRRIDAELWPGLPRK